MDIVTKALSSALMKSSVRKMANLTTHLEKSIVECKGINTQSEDLVRDMNCRY